MTDKPETPDHWLARPETIRKLWLLLIAVLVALLAAEALVGHHGHFAFDNLFGYGAWSGFLACVALVVAAKALAVIVKRRDTYYDD